MKKIITLLVSAIIFGIITGCNHEEETPRSTSGVSATRVTVQTGPDGLTGEQRNVGDRVIEDNKPGSIKHLYVISAYSGQVIIYSTVRQKVTSSGKRLTPNIVDTNRGYGEFYVPGLEGSNRSNVYTNEVIQDDGTYGTSSEYLYWWDTKGVYHQHYISGGQIVHISNQPLVVKGIIINMELTQKSEEQK